MSIQGKAEVKSQTDNFLHVDYDNSKLVLFAGEFGGGLLANNTGATASFPIGTVLARNSSTGNLVPYNSANTGNGIEEIVGILYTEVTDLADATTIEVDMVNGGEVREDKVLFVNDGTDSIDSANPVTLRTHRDDLKRVGVRVKYVDELYEPDNA